MEKIPCSIPILTLNAKPHLERLLPSLVEAFDDVYVMDGNSTDGTQDCARSLGVRIERQFETDEPNRRITDFGAMRMRLWSKAKHDWLFILDSDEEILPELINRVRGLVAEDARETAYTFPVLTRLPDRRIVLHALYYPFRYIRLFRRSSGITLGGRAVHERFFVPDRVRVIDCTEPVIEPQPSAREWGARQRRYLPLAAMNIPSTRWGFYWRWIFWYHLRSIAGQFLKAVAATVNGWRLRETSLPWSYNLIFFHYFASSFLSQTRAWRLKRRQQTTTALLQRHAEIIETVRARSPFDPAETERILRKFFAKVPRVVRLLTKEYSLQTKKVLEIGCSYGQTLMWWGPGSSGVEVFERSAAFARALGLKVHALNVEEGFGDIQETFDIIFTNNLLEHIVAPHLYLARLNALLNSGGMLVVGHPVVPSVVTRWLWKAFGYNGWLAGEHINFFTPATARLTYERGGFRVVRQYCSGFGRWRFLNWLVRPFAIQTLTVCRKIDGYRYDSPWIFEPSWASDLKRFHRVD